MTEPQTSWQIAFNIAVDVFGGVRKLARGLEISPSTVTRLAQGEAPSPQVAQKIGPVIGTCPCCGQSWPSQKED